MNVPITTPFFRQQFGCFYRIAILPCSINNPKATTSIKASWLPCMEEHDDNKKIMVRKNENIIPVLPFSEYQKIYSVLDNEIRTQYKFILPVPFCYRPKAFDCNDFYGMGAGELVTHDKKIHPMENRIVMDLWGLRSDSPACEFILDLCRQPLLQTGLTTVLAKYINTYGNGNKKEIINDLLSNFPALIHYVFASLPDLHILEYRTHFNGAPIKISQIRYNYDLFFGFRHSKYVRTGISFDHLQEATLQVPQRNG